MNRTAVLAVACTAAIAGGSGVALAWSRWFFDPIDELAIVNSPAEPVLLAIHVLAVPVLVFVLGVIAASHAVPRLRKRRGERSRLGLVLIGLLAPLILSGPATQVVEDESARRLIGYVHGGTGILWLLALTVHACSPRLSRWIRSRRDRSLPAPDRPPADGPTTPCPSAPPT
ncbi:MAG: hypothetical protein HZB39_20280 [Planctomycetes bacterium]|nr:hypothetical protein [Planctomycetota bacterium]